MSFGNKFEDWIVKKNEYATEVYFVSSRAQPSFLTDAAEDLKNSRPSCDCCYLAVNDYFPTLIIGCSCHSDMLVQKWI